MSRDVYHAAVLIDAGYLLCKLHPLAGHRHAKAAEVLSFARLTLQADERLFRIYFYDCPPFEGRKTNPVDGSVFDFSATTICRARKSLQDSLSKSDHIAFREGVLQFEGWKIPTKAIQQIRRRGGSLQPGDVQPEIRQKRMDMKIGLDVAWLASKRIVERIILITADTDFVPAMKFARREGVQVIVATPDRQVPQDMLRHADEFRVVAYPSPPATLCQTP